MFFQTSAKRRSAARVSSWHGTCLLYTSRKAERHGGKINLRVLLENGITVVAVNKGVVPNNQRREQLALFEDVFFKLLKFCLLYTSRCV